MPLDPYFSAGKLAWLLEHDEEVAARRASRDAAHGHRRLVPVRPARRRLRHRPLDRVAHPAARRSATPGWDPRLLRALRRAARRAAGDRATPPASSATLRHESWPVGAAAARARWWTSRRRSPAPAASSRAASRRPTAPACSSSPTSATSVPRAGGRPAPDRGLAHRRAGRSTRSTAASSRPARCSSGCAATSGSPTDPPALARARRARSRTPPASGCFRRWPGSGRRGGARTPARCRRAHGGTHARRTSRAPRSRGSPGGSPTSSPRRARRRPVEALRVDGGLTNEPLLLQLQADATGVPVEPGGVDATAAGAAALAAVGAGVWLDARDRRALPVGSRVEPAARRRWRDEHHAAWRRFVERAAELG